MIIPLMPTFGEKLITENCFVFFKSESTMIDFQFNQLDLDIKTMKYIFDQWQ